MKFFLKVFAATILSISLYIIFRLAINVSIFQADLASLGSFLQILGTLYGIMAAFIIYVVWGRYDKIKETAKQETDNLSELYSLVTYLEDEKINQQIKTLIINYANAVIDRGWKKLYQGKKSNKASEALDKIYTNIKFIKSERKRFPIIFGQLVEKFEDVSDLRTQRITLSTEHLPQSLKFLIIFDSLALILSTYFLPLNSYFLSLFIVFVISGTVFLTLNVIFDLDNPLVPGEWNLTPEPFKDLIEELKEKG